MWHHVGHVDEIGPGEARKVPGRVSIAVFNVAGQFFGVEDTCTHAASSLSEEGYVDGDVVQCGWHLAKFSLRTGSVLGPPACRALRTFEVKIDSDGTVLVNDEDVLTQET
jgi:nitrite reductase/ring-hydroxylating ferredoxin subunit